MHDYVPPFNIPFPPGAGTLSSPHWRKANSASSFTFRPEHLTLEAKPPLFSPDRYCAYERRSPGACPLPFYYLPTLAREHLLRNALRFAALTGNPSILLRHWIRISVAEFQCVLPDGPPVMQGKLPPANSFPIFSLGVLCR